MCRQPSEQSVQAALGAIVPSHVTVHSLRPVASLRPQRIFEVSLSDGKTLLLSLPPQALFRLLRHEQSLIGSEAATVRWIRDALARNYSTRFTKPTLQRFLPALVHTSSHGPAELGSAYNVFEHQHGIPVALLPSPPSPSERKRLDKHLGQFYRSLSSITSPSGRFGPVAAVVPKMPGVELSDKNAGFGEGGLMAADGARNWSTAFQSLLEGVLRDGEDMAVTMAYSPIRRHFRRFAHLLNEVKVPRLVVVDMADDTNTLVTVETPTSTNGYGSYMATPQAASTSASDNIGGERQLTLTGLQDWSNCVFGDPLLATVFSDGISESFMEGFETGPPTTNANERNGSSSRNTSVSTHSTNTGVMSITAITEQTTISSPPRPPPPPPPAVSSSNNNSSSSDGDISSLIEDLPNAGIRLLLYQVYHAALCIVKEFYRPRSAPPSTCSSPTSSSSSSLSTNRELEARKKLTEALNRLEAAVPVVTPTSSLGLPVLPHPHHSSSTTTSSSSSSASCISSSSSTKKQNLLLNNNNNNNNNSNHSSPVASARSLLLGVKDNNNSNSRSSDSVLAKKKLHHRPSGDMSPAKRAKSAGSDEERE
ncbi:hypothetical protein B0T09DRAFT_294387 [Sordaria sp. MPI-SDFR-AT-0083]|nr:hypothetical protein B0T09DRAFT_294387 [Sordaria sp. MPI-SDFR-AT-0083]